MADIQQSKRQASIRAVTGTTGTYEGDWHALFTSLSIPAGDFNGRLLQYINTRLSASYTNINSAMAAMAAAEGASNFQAIGTFTASLDSTAPTLSNATDTATGQTTADVGVDTNEANGKLYVVVTTSSTSPTKAQVKAGQDNSGVAAAYASSQEISSTGTKAFSATGLAAGTAYTAHFMHEDAASNQSTVVKGNGFTTDAAASLILDTYTSAAFAVSAARKLRTAYAGNCIEVTETGGSTDANIGFTGDALDETALTTHTSSNNGLIRTWYDQSGNALDALGTAFSDSDLFKPVIVASGTVNKFNTKPSIVFDNSGYVDSLYITSPGVAADASCTILFVFNKTASTTIRNLIGGVTGSLDVRLTAGHKIEILREFQASIFTTTTSVPTQFCAVAVVIDDTGTSSVKINANSAETFTTDVTASAAIRMISGTQLDGNNLATGGNFDSGISEIIVWPTAFNDTDRDAVLADAITFYGIT